MRPRPGFEQGRRPSPLARLLLGLLVGMAATPSLLWLAYAGLQGSLLPGPENTTPAWAVAGCLLALGIGAALMTWLSLAQPALRRLQVAEERLIMRGREDPLTGLLNREGLRVLLGRELQRGKGRLRVGVVVLDIDRFHLINDSLGQPVGDEVLRTVADRIRSVVQADDEVARLAADRFVVQVRGTSGPLTLAAMARNLLRAMEPACSLAGREMVLTPSIGTALANDLTTGVDDLLKCAELALRAAKSAGGGGFRHFEPALLEQHDLWLDLENRLRHTLHRNGFELAFQPIFDGSGKQIVAVEALLRWPEPGRQKMVSPTEFVPVLEQTGLIVPVGRWVLQQACRQAMQWLSQGAHGLILSVNVSPRQFAEADFTATVAGTLAQTGFPANRLQIEVTEGLLLSPSNDTLRKLNELVKTGVRLAIDDFGIGHSSLAYLKTFPLHTLKIDRMFVRDLTDHGQGHDREKAIARAIIELGHSLGLKVTAEGVETAEQARILHTLGCDALQGFLLAQPVAAADMRWLLNERGAVGVGEKPHSQWSDTMAGLETG